MAGGTGLPRRTLRKLGPRKVATCEAPVVFSKDAARSILGTFAGCIVGVVDRTGAYLYLQKHRIARDRTALTITVDGVPARAGIDPLNKLIDRIEQGGGSFRFDACFDQTDYAGYAACIASGLADGSIDPTSTCKTAVLKRRDRSCRCAAGVLDLRTGV